VVVGANMRISSASVKPPREERAMDETTFEYEAAQLAEASRRFPAHRRAMPVVHPESDFGYLRTAPSAEFGRHVWDEGGHA
jgi:hypothetical protein